MSEYKKPLPVVQPWSQAFWDGTKQGKLLVQVCKSCGAHIFNPRKFCPKCWSAELGWMEASGRAKIYSFTVTYEGIEEIFRTDLPIILAWVDLEEGVRMLTNIVDCDPDEVTIGDDVKVAFRKATNDFVMPMFKLV